MKKILPLMIFIVLLFAVLVNTVPPDDHYPWYGRVRYNGIGVAGVNVKIIVEIPVVGGGYCECASTADIVSVENYTDVNGTVYNYTDGSWANTTDGAKFKWNGQGNSTYCGSAFYPIGVDCHSGIQVVHNTYAVTTNASNLGYEEGIAAPYYQQNSSCYFEDINLTKNDPPIITGIPDNWTYEDVRPSWLIDLWNYTTDDKDNLSDLNFTVIVHNTTLINAFIQDGRYINFTQPGANLTGNTLVTVIVTDTGGKSNNDTFIMTVIPVNDPPWWLPLTINVPEDYPNNTAINLNSYTLDIDNASNELTYSLVNQSNASLINCTVMISGGIPYLNCSPPAPDQTGTNYVYLNVSDGELWAIGLATVNVNPVNDPPTISGIPDNWTYEDTAPPWQIDLWLYANDTEDAVNAMTYTIIGQTNSSLINCVIIANRYANCSTPAANATGYSNITVRVRDTGGLTDTDTFMVTVVPVNDPPSISNANISLLLNTPSTIDLIDVLNYFDPDFNETHNFTLIGTAPNGTNFTITDGINGIAQFIGNQVGIFNFTINVTDSGNLSDTAILSINVISMDVIVVKTIQAIDEDKYEVTITVYNYNNESKDFYNLTLTDPEFGNITFDLDYRTNVFFRTNVSLNGTGIVPFTIATIHNPDLGTYYYSNEESVYIKECPDCPPGGGGGGGGGGCPACPPSEPCEPTECEPCEPTECEPGQECKPCICEGGARCEPFECNFGFDHGFRFEVINKEVDCDGGVRYIFKVTNDNYRALSYLAIGLPDVASPGDGSVYHGNNNDYNIENPTNNPFYSIKFETIGEGIVSGEYDIFEILLPYNPGDAEIKIQAKAGQIIGTAILKCNGETCLPCGLVGEAFRFGEGGFWLWPLLLLLLLLFRRKILIVGTRNTFRSVLAEYLLRRILRKKKPLVSYWYKIISSGIFALNGKKPSTWFVEFAKLDKLNVSRYKTKAVTEKMVKRAFKIIVMERWHKDFIVTYALGLRDKKELEKELLLLWTKLGKMKQQESVKQSEINEMEERIKKLRKDIKKIEKLEKKIWVLNMEDPIGEDVTKYKKCYDILKRKLNDKRLLYWITHWRLKKGWDKYFMMKYGLGERGAEVLKEEVMILRNELNRMKKEGADQDQIGKIANRIRKLREDIKRIEELDRKIKVLDKRGDRAYKDGKEYFERLKRIIKDDEIDYWREKNTMNYESK